MTADPGAALSYVSSEYVANFVDLYINKSTATGLKYLWILSSLNNLSFNCKLRNEYLQSLLQRFGFHY